MRGSDCLFAGVAVAAVAVAALAVACRSATDPVSDPAADSTSVSDTVPSSASASGLGSHSARASAAPHEPYDWRLPPDVAPPPVPARNPMTAARVELGRHLFYDRRLSFNQTQSCATCHVQALGFADGKRLPTGSTGQALVRNSPGLQNAAYLRSLTWNNPLLAEIERHTAVPLFSETPIELDWTGHDRAIVARLAADARYRALFRAAFPDAPAPSRGHVLYALSAFVRSMVAFESPYDRYRRGDAGALSAAAGRGLALFESERLGCRGCHAGDDFTAAAPRGPGAPASADAFANVGLYDADGQGAYPATNTGLHELSQRPEDMGRMRVPSLRNVALTAPYRHDGSVATLEGVIREYEAGGRGPGRSNRYKDPRVRGFTLSDRERADLVAFLESLTDRAFVESERFSNPWR